MLGSAFAFRGYSRRIARSVVDAMAPRWDDFDDSQLDEELLGQVEAFVRGYPPVIQVGVLIMLYTMEFGGPLISGGLRPLSFSDRERVMKRLEFVADHKIAYLRSMTMLWKIMVCFPAYSRADVEAHLGLRRREWRASRKVFRELLLQIDESRGAPKVPAPLVDSAVVHPDEYLNFDAEKTLRTPRLAAGGERV